MQRKLRWKLVKMGVLSVHLVYSALCLVQAQPYIPWTDKASGETLRTTLEAFHKIGAKDPSVAKVLASKRESLAIVFVPGILGSALTDKNGRMIYGDLSEPSTLISRLELPADLIDEKAESGIQPKLLRSLGPMDLYGEAVDTMQKWASDNQIKFITCGYDWRRDLRSGARDLERCISQQLDAKHRDLVVISHSMGGLVSWIWATKHEHGDYSINRRLLQLTTLGSPLTGSCEIVRMVQSGYIQPERNESVKARNDFKPLKSITEKFVDAFENGVSAQFTQGIRPLVLTWPGAIELSPGTPEVAEQISCVGVPSADENPVGTPETSYYDTAFWVLPAGKQMLRKGNGPDSYSPSSSLLNVLSKAKEFRNGFKAKQLQVPAWVYYSRIWKVPSEAGYRAPYISEANEWSTVWGDGRVPYTSALNSPDTYVFSHRMGVESVHGNLPADPNFFDDYFGNRLPQALAAIWTIDMMKAAIEDPKWIEVYAKLLPYGADISQIRTAIEPTGAPGKESTFLKLALASTAKFNSEVCEERSDCPSSYAAAKAAVAAAPADSNLRTRLAQFSAAARLLGTEDSRFPYAEGNRGLALARSQDWEGASVSLQRAQTSLQSFGLKKNSPSTADIQFNDVLQRNLGRSLIETGQCKAAEPYLRATADSWPYSREALTKPCNDLESGLQYCFDTGDYCRAL
ncbi:hypothetical protein F6R97_05805 [Pseudomonas sp. JV414]|uniref:esterase/lipase family protein n=1 Tax=Pseudomonas sp. JV414 TaxID=1733110 RepID=UPI0028E116FE|nr:hypothetical protein [Pseudomonas sp. JV414]MDT9674153.1 hypothetical protein [Pseudomonas sp. JV414]